MGAWPAHGVGKLLLNGAPAPWAVPEDCTLLKMDDKLQKQGKTEGEQGTHHSHQFGLLLTPRAQRSQRTVKVLVSKMAQSFWQHGGSHVVVENEGSQAHTALAAGPSTMDGVPGDLYDMIRALPTKDKVHVV